MTASFKYKDFIGSIEVDTQDRLLFGKVLFINSLLMYHGNTLDELEAAFQETVEEYLKLCERKKMVPERSFTGTFQVRVGPERHKQLAAMAELQGVSLNALVNQLVDREAASGKPLKLIRKASTKPGTKKVVELRPQQKGTRSKEE
jgi:predicted HicB family RNase H-like nuclease